MQNKTGAACSNDSCATPLSPAERTTVLSTKIYDALHGQPKDLPTMLEMVQTFESLVDALRITDLEKMLLRQRITVLIEIAAVGGLVEYFNAVRAQILRCFRL